MGNGSASPYEQPGSSGVHSDQAGRLIGQSGMLIDERYRLDRLLGAGGFGEVWRASQEVEGSEVRPVALKLLAAPSHATGSSGPPTPSWSPADAGSSGASAYRWLDEVRAVRDVRCASVATIFDVGISRTPRVAYIAMELLSGQTLDDRLKRGAVYWRRALAMAREVATALVACHQVGVTHCDLKPQNVFLSRDGSVYVLDFGVAALGSENARPTDRFPHGAAHSEGAQTADIDPFELGATGAVSLDEMPDAVAPAELEVRIFGTPGYIAPENFRGERPAPASDIYALGVLLYRVITGRLPYRLPAEVSAEKSATTREGIQRFHAALNAASVRGDVTPLGDVAPDVPRAVADLIDAMLANEPDDRPTDRVLDALDEVWRCPHGVPDPPYIGLAAFDEHRAGYIAGRDADIDDITDKLRDNRAIVLCGPSGCGKSSLAIAGVAPRIDAELLGDTDGWRLVSVRPSEPNSLQLADRAAPDAGDARTGVVVVIDQLEEVLRLPDAERRAFCEALASLVEGDRPVSLRGAPVGRAVRIVATVRDDLFGPVAALPELRRFPEKNLYTVRGVEPNAMPSIVTRPASDAGYRLEGGAEVVAEATRIVADDPGALPLVQFALTRWWESRDRDARVLLRSEWRAIGGIEGALAEAAQALYDSLDARERDHMRSLLLALFRPDGTRVSVRQASVADDGPSRTVLDRLVDRRLVTRHVADETSIEVVHEALARRWPLLHTWLEETRSERELLHDATHDAERWNATGKPRDLLWRGQRLDAAMALADRLGPAREFIATASRLQTRQRWRSRGTIGLLAILVGLAVVLILGYVASTEGREEARRAHKQAVTEQERAEAARQQAEAALTNAIESRDQADEDRQSAMDERQKAEQARREAEQSRAKAEDALKRNNQLLGAAEAARRIAEQTSQQARAQAEAAAEQQALASRQLTDVDRQRKYAETAQRLHEMAQRRSAQVEETLTQLEAERDKLLDRVRKCERKPRR